MYVDTRFHSPHLYCTHCSDGRPSLGRRSALRIALSWYADGDRTQHRDTRRDTDAPRRYDDSSRHNEPSRYNGPSRYNEGSRYSEPSRYHEGPSRAPPSSSSLPASSSSAPRPHYSQADQDFDRTFGQKNR
jgi:hypothetical protein